jgi:hypothetical protein
MAMKKNSIKLHSRDRARQQLQAITTVIMGLQSWTLLFTSSSRVALSFPLPPPPWNAPVQY